MSIQPGKVFCVTLNTAVDHVIEVDALAVGTTSRVAAADLVAAGKGVDVAVGVAELGGRAIATGFIGEASRGLFAKLEAEHVELMFIEVPGSTRINVTILERDLCRETHLQTVGYSISLKDLQRLRDVLQSAVNPSDVVLIGGSLPPGDSEGAVAGLISLCKESGAYVILDASGAALLDGLNAQPQMVKPNLLELSQIVGRPIDNSDEGVVHAATECLHRGLERVVVSRGYRGIIVVEKGQTWKAWIDSDQNRTTAGVGSGDALVAAFALGILLGRPLDNTMRLGVACGAANLLTRLPGRFDADEAARLVQQAQIQRLC